MRSASALRAALVAALAAALAACGGGNSSQTTLIGGGAGGSQTGPEVTISQPQGSNTTEIVVDRGPATGFAFGAANLPYVTVRLCRPGSTSVCATIDHVFLDTGSIGLRVLRSAVAGLSLPAVNSGSAAVVECFPFVVGAVWGPLARADVSVGGELASNLPIQLIDDGAAPVAAATADCRSAANGDLLASAGALQANGVLGIGMLGYDCGLRCDQGQYAGGYVLYYACDAGGTCQPAAWPAGQQVQNPVSHFAQDNNGTLIVLPAVPDGGAVVARGRLVFGIGTQANNQLPANATVLYVDPDPQSPTYFYLGTTVGGTAYPYSYVDSGSNGYFFDDPGLSLNCVGSGSGGSWYCPPVPQSRTAQVADVYGNRTQVRFSIGNADLLFYTANTAFSNLGGAAGSTNAGAFVWGLSFFFGRSVYTSIWGQALSPNGPWVAF
jgi:hypothetical protein